MREEGTCCTRPAGLVLSDLCSLRTQASLVLEPAAPAAIRSEFGRRMAAKMGMREHDDALLKDLLSLMVRRPSGRTRVTLMDRRY